MELSSILAKILVSLLNKNYLPFSDTILSFMEQYVSQIYIKLNIIKCEGNNLMKIVSKILGCVLILYPVFIIAADSERLHSGSTISYSIRNNLFEFTRNELDESLFDILYWSSKYNNEREKILEKKVEQNNEVEMALGFNPEVGLSPDRKFMMVFTFDYPTTNISPNNNDEATSKTGSFHCHFISTETGKIVYTGIGKQCEFEWHPNYSGVIKINQYDVKNEVWKYNKLFSLRHHYCSNDHECPELTNHVYKTIKYEDVKEVIPLIKSLYQDQAYEQIREIAAEKVFNLEDISQKNIEEFNQLGYYYLEAGASGEAIQILSAICIYDNSQASATLNLADTYWHIKDYDRAEYYYIQYVSIMKNMDKLNDIPERIFSIFNVSSAEQLLQISLIPNSLSQN